MKIIQKDQPLYDIANLGKLSPLMHVALVGIVASLLYSVVDRARLANWIGLVLAVVFLRFLLHIPVISRKLTYKSFLYSFSALAILQSSSWGFGVAYFSGHLPMYLEMFLIFLAGGISALAVAFLAPLLPLYIIYACSLMGPVIISLILKGDNFSLTIGISCLVYLITMLFAALTVNKNYKNLQKTRSILKSQVGFVESIYNSATDISFITCDMSDESHQILSCSLGSEEIFEIKCEDAIGKPLSAIFSPDAYKSCEEMLKKAENGARVRKEIDLVKNIGVINNLSVSAYPLYSEDNHVKAVLIKTIDISRSKQTEEALVDSEEKFKNIIESSPIGMYMFQLDARGRLILIHSNPAADDLTGIDNQKLIGTTIEQAFPGLIGTEIPEKYKMVATTGVPCHTDQVIYQDGKISGAFEIHAFQTSPGKMVSTFINVTDRVNTERALRESEERFRDIAHSSSDWIWEIDSIGRFTYVSEGVKNVLGYDPEELLGTCMFDLSGDDESENIKEKFIMLSSRKMNIVDLIHWILHKDGRLICIETNGVPILDKDGNLVGYRGVNKDITEQKRYEEQLRQSEERYRTLIENMDEGLVIVNLEGLVIFANRSACDIFGLDKNRLIGSEFNDVVLNHDLSIVYQNIIECRDKGFGKNELSIKRLDGKSKHIYLSAMQLKDRDGVVFGSFGIFTDVTELKRAERERLELREQLTNAQRMESLGMLAGGVAHDLNNILGPLVAYPDLIKMKIPKDSKIINDITKIQSSAQRAADVVQDLLTMARRGRYQMGPIEMKELVSSYLKSPEFTIIKSRYPNIRITPNLRDKLPKISGSEPHLLKVIMNLIINAMEAMPNGGELKVDLDFGFVEKLAAGFDNIEVGDYIILIISDTGLGIPEWDLKHVFEPFYSKKKMGKSGSGLGLAIVYGVVKDHNGYIDVHSVVDKGSEFYIYLPVSDIKESKTVQVSVDIRGSEKILVVDDIQEQRDLAATILSSLGYDVTTAASGHEAVEYMKNNQADVVILDMIMEEDFDGLETYREIIKIHPGQKAIIASGFSETDRVKEAEKLGVGKYVPKPYNMQILGRAIREVLSAVEPVAK